MRDRAWFFYNVIASRNRLRASPGTANNLGTEGCLTIAGWEPVDIVGIVPGTEIGALMDIAAEELMEIAAVVPRTVDFFLPAGVDN